MGKITILGAKGTKVPMLSQGQGWSNVRMWPPFIATVQEINNCP